MAKRSTKFGTFGGVFTPSILTILGVIMYLRLPMVVGNAGLWKALGVITAAHVISVTTGLSISSIATDKKVGAGGPYYIVSRSLGLPIGGTLGLALFVGLSFSISLYVIGFSESFLSYWGIEATKENIQICGTATIVALTVVTLISTSFAIKTQYVILGLIALSLISIAFAPATGSAGPHLSAPEGALPLAEIFGIFFPAVTGFTAGVNMSGDLRDPKKSIPVGTMASIGVGAIVYMSLAVFLAFRMPVGGMLDNTNILVETAWIPILVIGGIWGATLSSGLGSILGAPRILQALSGDRVFFNWFAKGHGKDNEPRRALLIAFAIGEVGILIGELNAIARVVSIFFIATYGFLNLSCAIESWASTDFRPEFRIPRTLSVIGALTCALMMIQLDLPATIGATVLFALLFAILKRREISLESGDTWEGVWSSLVRWGLEKLDAGGNKQSNWRPNVIALSWRASQDHGPLLAFGTELIRDRGVLTDYRLRTPKESRQRRAEESEARREARAAGERPREPEEEEDDDDEEALVAGLFERELETEDPWLAARSIARFHGFAGLEPNTVMLSWAEHTHDGAGFAATLDELVELDFNVLLLAVDPKRGFGEHERIDLWWTPEQGSFELGIALIRFLSLSDDWRRSEVRFLLLNDDPSRGDALFKSAQRALADARVNASVKVFNNAIGNRPFHDWVRQESADADLTVLGLPPGPFADEDGRARIEALHELTADIGSVLIERGSSHFTGLLQVGRRRAAATRADKSIGGTELDVIELAPLAAPEPSELRAAARELSMAHDDFAREFHTECLSLIYSHDAALIEQLQGVVERAFDQLGGALRERATLRQRKQLNKVQSSFLFQARRSLSEFESDRLAAQVDALEHRIEGWIAAIGELEREAPKTLTVTRDPAILRLSREDSPRLRRAKRRLRRRQLLRRRELVYSFNVTPLYTWALRWRSLSILDEALRDTATDAYYVLLELGRSISEARHALDEFAQRLVELPPPRAKSEVEAKTKPKAQLAAGAVDKLFAPPGSTGGSTGGPAGSAAEGGPEPAEAREELEPHERAKRELAARIAERRDLVVERLEKLGARVRKHNEQSRDLLMRASRRLAQGFADDIDRLDVRALIRHERKLPREAAGLQSHLLECAAIWRRNRQLVLNRASLELHNAGFQQRLRAIVERTKDATRQTIQTGILHGTRQLRQALGEYRAALEEAGGEGGAEPVKLRFTRELRSEFDDKKVVEDLAREAQAASAELPDAIEVIGDDALMFLEHQPFEESEVLTVSLRRLVDFLVQAEFLGGLREPTARVALAEQRALGVAQDVLHLVSFNLSEAEHEPEHDEHISLAERVGPVIDNGLGRLDAELASLESLAPTLAERIDTQLGKILDRTEAYAITGSEDSFKLHVRHEQSGRGALSKVGRVTRWAEHLSKRVLVALMYRWSAGVLLARQIQTEGRGNVVERVLGFVNAHSPRPETLDALPFFYSQPFLGQARVSVEFWVGRQAELSELATAIRNWRQGRGGALLIIGERHSGKTSLARYVARKHFEKRAKFNLLPPRGGSADLALFRSRLEKELKLPAADTNRDWDEIMASVPEGSVIMIHDLELWWERGGGESGESGDVVLERIMTLIERFGDRLLFILELNSHAYRFISRSVNLADQALAVVECQPFDAEQLKEVIEVRHRSTGLGLVIEGRDEDELPAWNRARLYTRYFDYTGGYVGVALQSWITHIERVEGERLHMRGPKSPSLEIFDELRLEFVALLLQFVLHKRLTRARLLRVTGLDELELERKLDALLRMGLLGEDKQGVLEINRYVQHMLVESLREGGYL